MGILSEKKINSIILNVWYVTCVVSWIPMFFHSFSWEHIFLHVESIPLYDILILIYVEIIKKFLGYEQYIIFRNNIFVKKYIQ